VIVAVAAGAVATLWQARIAHIERDRAQQRFEDVRRLARVVMFDFHDAVAKLPGAMPIQQMLIDKSIGYFESMARESRNDPEILAEAGEGYLRLGDVLGNPYRASQGKTGKSIETYRRGIELMGNPPASELSVAFERARAALHKQLGRSLRAAGDPEGTERHGRESFAIIERLARRYPADTEVQSDFVKALEDTGDFYFLNPKGPDYGKAYEYYHRAREIYAGLESQGPVAGIVPRNGLLSYKLGACRESLGDLTAAVALYREGLDVNNRLPEEIRREVRHQRARASILSILASGLASLGEPGEALTLAEESVAITREMAESDPSNVRAAVSLVSNITNRNSVLESLGDRKRLLAGREEAAALWDRILASSPQDAGYRAEAALNRIHLSTLFAESGDLPAARRNAVPALAALRLLATGAKAGPPDFTRYAAALIDVQPADLRDPHTALEMARRAVEAGNPTPEMLSTLGTASLQANEIDSAVRAFEQALSLLPKAPAGGPLRARIEARLAEAREKATKL
jgi:tetratricopeptide (TPR) repeat protein